MKKKTFLITILLTSLFLVEATSQSRIMTNTGTCIVHTVLFRFTEHATASQISQLMSGINNLKNKIPGILKITSGRNFSERSKGFTYAVNVLFQDSTALSSFYKHPDHQELIQHHIKPIIADMIVIDYKDGSQ